MRSYYKEKQEELHASLCQCFIGGNKRMLNKIISFHITETRWHICKEEHLTERSRSPFPHPLSDYPAPQPWVNQTFTTLSIHLPAQEADSCYNCWLVRGFDKLKNIPGWSWRSRPSTSEFVISRQTGHPDISEVALLFFFSLFLLFELRWRWRFLRIQHK